MKNKIYLFTASVLLLFGLFVYESIRFNDGKLHLVFCNVGQGTAVFIRTPKGADIIIDAGPDDSVLKCLSSHMPFWDRDIEIAFMTHTDSDHMTGFLEIVERYSVVSFYTSNVKGGTQTYNELEKLFKKKKVKTTFTYAGDKFKISDGVIIKTLWPEKGYDFSSVKTDKNMFSLVQVIQFGKFETLLTGDIEAEDLDRIVSSLDKVDIFELPHHGSKTGIDRQTFKVLKPDLAVISVGANNRYGHPSSEVLQLLKQNNIPFRRTDQNGEVEIVIPEDGNGFEIN